jgi:hypothetical protein
MRAKVSITATPTTVNGYSKCVIEIVKHTDPLRRGKDFEILPPPAAGEDPSDQRVPSDQFPEIPAPSNTYSGLEQDRLPVPEKTPDAWLVLNVPEADAPSMETLASAIVPL